MKAVVFISIMTLALQGKTWWFDKGIPTGPPPIFSQEIMDSVYDKLLLDTPAGAMIGGVLPKTYQEIITQGHDAPISLIQIQHTSSRDYWLKLKSKRDSRVLSALKMDTEIFGELNLRAAKVWDELVACNGHSGEAARRAFFEFQNLCPSPDQNAWATDNLKELAQNYQQFLISTPIIDIDDLSRPGKTPPVFDALGNGIHPLIAQFAIQQWAAFLNHPAEQKSPISYAISDMLYRRSQNAQYLRMDSEIFRQAIRPLASAEETLLKVVVNNLVVLGFLNGEHLPHSCGIYGLWPAMNRVILRHESLLWGGLGSSLRSYLMKLDSAAQGYCGRPVRYINFGIGTEGIYGASGTLHIANLRVLYGFYVGTTWQKDIEK